MSWRGLRTSQWKLLSWVFILILISDWLKSASFDWLIESEPFWKPILVWIYSKNNEKYTKLVWNTSKVKIAMPDSLHVQWTLSMTVQARKRSESVQPWHNKIQNHETDAYGRRKDSVALEHSNQLERMEFYQAGFLNSSLGFSTNYTHAACTWTCIMDQVYLQWSWFVY